jgi:hypothetical protein
MAQHSTTQHRREERQIDNNQSKEKHKRNTKIGTEEGYTNKVTVEEHPKTVIIEKHFETVTIE